MIHTLHSQCDREEGDGKRDMEMPKNQNTEDWKSLVVGWISNAPIS